METNQCSFVKRSLFHVMSFGTNLVIYVLCVTNVSLRSQLFATYNEPSSNSANYSLNSQQFYSTLGRTMQIIQKRIPCCSLILLLQSRQGRQPQMLRLVALEQSILLDIRESEIWLQFLLQIESEHEKNKNYNDMHLSFHYIQTKSIPQKLLASVISFQQKN